jgi:two-component system cell cycle sensor histidine kinase/response regulator CckA
MQQTTGATLTERMVMITPHRLFVLLGLAVVLCSAAAFSLDGTMQSAVFAAGRSLICVAGMLFLVRIGHHLARRQSIRSVSHFISNDSTPSFVTKEDGKIVSSNAAAMRTFGQTDGSTLAGTLSDRIGNPGPMLFRLQTRAAASGSVREEIVTNRG